jgi:hypothetical protein
MFFNNIPVPVIIANFWIVFVKVEVGSVSITSSPGSIPVFDKKLWILKDADPYPDPHPDPQHR